MHRDRFAQPRRDQLHAPAERARNQPHERDAIAVLRVHIGLYLEHEPGHILARRIDHALVRRLRARRRGKPRNGVDQFGHAKPLQRRSEIHRRQIAIAVCRQIEFGIADLGQFDFFGHRVGDGCAIDRIALAQKFAGRAFRARDRARGQVHHAFEQTAHAHRPRHRHHIQRQRIGHFVQRFKHAAPLAIDLVDKGDDRHLSQAAHFEQFARLRLDPFGRVDHHDRRIDRGQRAIGIFGKVLVARGVEQVEDDAVLLKGHDRAGHRNPALLLDLHPVGPGTPRLSPRLDLSGQVDRPALQQQLFGQGGLARVGVRDDGKGAAIGHGLGP